MINEARYTLKEIEMASGVSAGTLASRRKKRGIQANNAGYTYDEVKVLLQRPKKSRALDPKKADQLKRQLQNDGYK